MSDTTATAATAKRGGGESHEARQVPPVPPGPPGPPAPRVTGFKPPFDDVVAGLTVALVLVPQSVAYAALAGLPPATGLVAAMFPLLAAAALGSSPILQTGPTALTALLTLGVLASSFVPGTPSFIQAAALLAVLVGVVRFLAGIFGIGGIAYFMSLPVLRGFTSGAALLIIASQLAAAFGVEARGLSVWRAVWHTLTSPGSWNLTAIAMTVATLLLVRGLRRVSPLLPGALFAVVLGIVVSKLFGNPMPVIGSFSLDFPVPTLALPWGHTGRLALGAAVIAIVGFAEPAAIARTFTPRGKYWNADRELLAQGAANLVSGFMRGMPVGGSFSRSAVNQLAGARTRLSGAVAGLAVIAFFPFAFVLADLPLAVLAGIVIGASTSLLQLRQLFELWRYAKLQATTALVTFALTLALAPRIDYAVVLGISLALLAHLYREAQLGVRIDRNGSEVRINLEGVLWFGSMQALEKSLIRLEGDLSGVERVVLDVSRIGRVDFSSLMLINDTRARLSQTGVEVEVVGLHGRGEMVMGRIRRG